MKKQRLMKKAVLFVAAVFAMLNASATTASFVGGVLTINDLVAGTLKATIDAEVPSANLGTVIELIVTSGTINSADIRDGIVVSGDEGVAKYLPSVVIIDLSGATMSGRIDAPCFRRVASAKIIKLPQGATHFDGDSFPYCTNLEEIWLPQEFQHFNGPNMGEHLWQTNSLKKFVVNSGSTTFKAGTDGVLYSADGETLVKYPTGKTDTSYTIADGTVRIGSNSFRYASLLKNVNMPNSLREIGTDAFGSTNLENVLVPEGVTLIKGGAFYGLDQKIKSIILPTTLIEIEEYSFYNLSNQGRAQIIFQNTTLPITGSMPDTFWDTTNAWIGVPSSKLEDYRDWYGDAAGGDSGKRTHIRARVKAYNTITVTNGTTEYPIAVSGDDINVPISTTMPDFLCWSSDFQDVTFADITSPTTTFTVPASVEGAAISVTANASPYSSGDVVIVVSNTTAGGLGAKVDAALAAKYPGKTKADINVLVLSGTLNNGDMDEIMSKTGSTYNYSGLKVLDLDGATWSGTSFLNNLDSPTLVELILPANLGILSGLRGQDIRGWWNDNNMVFEDAIRLISLEAISISDSNSNYKTIDGVLFSGDGKTLIYYPTAKPDLYYTVPSGVETLGHTSFSFSIYLRAVLVSEGVKVCGESAFYQCSELASITFPETLEEVQNWAIRKIEYWVQDGKKYPGWADGRSGFSPLKQVIFKSPTPASRTSDSHELIWDSNPFRFGVVDAAAVTTYSQPDASGGWHDAINKAGGSIANGIGIYQPIIVQQGLDDSSAPAVNTNIARSPYPFAVYSSYPAVQVPIIAADMNGTYPFKNWESTVGGVTFDDYESATTYFTMTDVSAPVVVTAIYDTSNTGIGKSEAVPSVSIYPSPATDVIYVKGLDANAGYKILDIAGKTVSGGSVNNGAPVSVASLSAGIYFFQINGETIKFIKK